MKYIFDLGNAIMAWLKTSGPSLIFQALVKYVFVGLGGFWGWILDEVVVAAWNWIFPKVQAVWSLFKAKEVDDQVAKKYADDIKQGVPVEQKIKDETDILNGGGDARP